jgi:NAD(P)-dependent dehydrogenase (short-subunit alcohol dehydrogenase family)
VIPLLRRTLERLLFPQVSFDAARLRRALGGRTVLVTGASFGIGEGVARIAAAHGARLLLVARTADKLEALADEIRAEGGEARAFAADLTDAAEVEALAPLLAAEKPDMFVSNAGKSIRRPLFESLDRFHDIDRTIGVNYLGPARLVLALIPGLVERRGQIVSISAANVLLPPAPRWAAYQASKAAFDQWLRSASPELRAHGVAVTRIYLPLVRTRMIAPTEIYREVPAMTPEQASRLVLRTMLTRQRRWTPWWLPPAALGGGLLRPLWEVLAERHERRAARR